MFYFGGNFIWDEESCIWGFSNCEWTGVRKRGSSSVMESEKVLISGSLCEKVKVDKIDDR